MNLIKHLSFNLKEKIFEITKPQLLVKANIFINDKLVDKFFCESLTTNFLLHLYNQFRKQNESGFNDNEAPFQTYAYRNESGVLTAGAESYLHIVGLSGIVTIGIVFGTGSNSVTPQDYTLQTKINNGTGVGQLSYGGQSSIQGVKVVGNKSNFIIQRIATNNSGATINISEIGLYAQNATSGNFLILRDLISPVKTVLSGQTITAQFEFSITT